MNILRKVKKFAKKEYKKNDKSHQWSHVRNVMKQALKISKGLKGVDSKLLKLAIIFHDIDYNSEDNFERNYKCHVDNSVKIAERFLEKENYPKEKIQLVKQVMLDHSTPHRKKLGESKILEGKILYDADKSIFIKTKETYEKYYPLLYLGNTKSLVRKFCFSSI